MINPRTIGVRLGLFNGGLVLAALLGLGGTSLVAVDRVLVAGAERILLDELLDVTSEVQAAKRALNDPELERLLLREAAEEHAYDVHYRLSLPDGTPLASSGERFWSRIAWEGVRGAETSYRTVRIPADPYRIRIAERLFPTPRGDLQLEVALRLEPEDVAMSRLLHAGALAVPAVIAMAALLGAFMARRALGPVDAIERAARTIGAGPRGRRLPAAGSGDELDRLADTLNAMLDRLERAAQRNLAFAGDVAHEVRTPLAVLRARIEQALAAPGEPSIEALEEAQAAVDRLDVLVRSLLALSRLDEGAAGPPDAPFDLGEVAREVVAFFAPAAEARGMELRLTVSGPAPLLGDRVAASRALANLVDNALAYAPAQTAVEVSVASVADLVTLTVADRGPGIPPDLVPRLFERFARGEHGMLTRPDGAGLGLALVRSVARGLGGDVSYAPRPGGGSELRLQVPLRATELSAPP